MTASAIRVRAAWLIIAAAFVLNVCGCERAGRTESLPPPEADYSAIPYPMETRELEEWFPGAEEIERAYWKSAGGTAETFTLSGFLIVEETGIKEGEGYRDVSYPEFPEGIDPFITGLKDFDWRSYTSVAERLLGDRFEGEALVDKGQRLYYLNVRAR